MAWKYKSNASQIKAALLKECSKATRKTADAIARGGSRKAPKRTGALRASMYVVDATPIESSDKNGFEQAKADAIAANAAVASSIEPKISLPTPQVGQLRCAVASAVSYAKRIEKGTYSDENGYTGAKAFLAPSADEQRPQHEARLRGAINKVEGRHKL